MQCSFAQGAAVEAASAAIANSDLPMIPAQSRAGRALLGWSRLDLAKAAGVSERTIVDFERGARQPRRQTQKAVRTAFEKAGIQLIEAEDGLGVGVRFNSDQLPGKPEKH